VTRTLPDAGACTTGENRGCGPSQPLGRASTSLAGNRLRRLVAGGDEVVEGRHELLEQLAENRERLVVEPVEQRVECVTAALGECTLAPAARPGGDDRDVAGIGQIGPALDEPEVLEAFDGAGGRRAVDAEPIGELVHPRATEGDGGIEGVVLARVEHVVAVEPVAEPLAAGSPPEVADEQSDAPRLGAHVGRGFNGDSGRLIRRHHHGLRVDTVVLYTSHDCIIQPMRNAVAHADAPAAEVRRLAMVRWSAALSALVTGMNLTVMNVAVADLRASFPDARFTTIGWVVSAYTIVFGAVLVPAGRLADRLGRRSVFMTGLAAFAAGSIIAGFAPSLWVLIAGRAVQGIGAACMTPSSIALLLDATPVSERAAAVSFYAGISAVGAASGPSIGALLVDATSWRFAFFLGLPVLSVAYLLGRRSLPASVPVREVALPDLAGSFMVMAAMTSLSFGIVQGRPWGWSHLGVVGAFAASAALVPLFVLRCTRHPSPVMAVGLFRRRSFAGANTAALLFGMATGGTSLANVLFLRDVWGYSLVVAGIGALPGPIAAISIARPVGRLGVRFGEAAVSLPGTIALALAMLWLRLFAHADANYWLGYVPGSVLLGMGVGATFPMIATAVVRGIGADQLSLASATNRTFLQLGNAIGIAVVVSRLGSAGPDALGDFHLVWTSLAVVAICCTAAVAYTGSTRPTNGPSRQR
jgi:MFS family permease